MAQVVINPRIRGFICTTSHPGGCAATVQRQIGIAEGAQLSGSVGNALVIGSSAGYGLSSLITLAFGYKAKVLGCCFERPGKDTNPGSPGFYNLAEVHAQAKARGLTVETLNGDAFAPEGKAAAIAALKARFGKLDHVVYSVATARRTDPATGITYLSTLKPIGPEYHAKTIDLDTDEVKPISIATATEADIEATIKVMGGDDWKMWIEALLEADLLAPGCRVVAYSYIGPQITHAIYRAGTIGRAKDHLEKTARELDTVLKTKLGGGAWVSVNKALVTQASSAIPVVPLYISLLYKVMKEQGSHEGTIEQIVRLWKEHLGPGQTPRVDETGRVRMDDRELAPEVQQQTDALWTQVTTESLLTLSDYASFKREFRGLFGFELDGIRYDQPVEVEASLV